MTTHAKCAADQNSNAAAIRNNEKDSLVLLLKGGLGNQLFQYAFARHLAQLTRRKILVDTSKLVRVNATPRPLYLSALGITVETVTLKELSFTCPTVEILQQINRSFVTAPKFAPNSKLALLDGYWQSERCFESVSAELRTDLRRATDGKHEGTSRLEVINNQEAVAVHIRRTDFLTAASSHLARLSSSYYDEAMQMIARRVTNPLFCIFSDDPEWCKHDFKCPYNYKLMSQQSTTDTTIDDFIVMSKCNHFIIPNSTYSWWAAWLGKDSKKLVVAPRHWFLKDSEGSRAIIPDSWITI